VQAGLLFSWWVAYAYAMLDDADSALDWLENAIERAVIMSDEVVRASDLPSTLHADDKPPVDLLSFRDHSLHDFLEEMAKVLILSRLQVHNWNTSRAAASLGIERTNLRIEIFRFTKELLRHERRTVGRLDSRFKGIDRDAVGERFEFDPSLTNITGPYTATLNDYIRGELKFESDCLTRSSPSVSSPGAMPSSRTSMSMSQKCILMSLTSTICSSMSLVQRRVLGS
jgi:hypothetical protein